MNQSNAQLQCQLQYGSDLATITSSVDQTLAETQCAASDLSQPAWIGCWIGLFQITPLLTEPYSWTDGTTVNYGFNLSSPVSGPPWATGQPGTDGETCTILWAKSSGAPSNSVRNFLWADYGCLVTHDTHILCNDPPTQSPTTDTSTPTNAPSMTPSTAPSVNPSLTPSMTPSVPPSMAPTFNPSLTPSITPSESPSIPPTFNPSLTPSITPSESPSIPPTLAPNVVPSMAPTLHPITDAQVRDMESTTTELPESEEHMTEKQSIDDNIKLLLIVVGCLGGIICIVGIVYVKCFLQKTKRDQENRANIQESTAIKSVGTMSKSSIKTTPSNGGTVGEKEQNIQITTLVINDTTKGTDINDVDGELNEIASTKNLPETPTDDEENDEKNIEDSDDEEDDGIMYTKPDKPTVGATPN